MPQSSVKCRLPFIPLLDVDQVKGIVQVQLNKGIGLMQQSKSRIKKRRQYLFFPVMLSPLKSMQGHRVLYFFSTKKKPVPTSEDVGRQRTWRCILP